MTVFVQDADLTIHLGDCLDVLKTLPDGGVDCVVTSPPYLNARPEYPSPTLDEFEAIFHEFQRIVAGPVLVNVGRTWYGGTEHLWWVDLLERARSHGWHLLDTLIWVKPNANPIHGAILADSHEYVFILGEPGMAFNTDAIRTAYTDESKARMARTWVNGRGVKGDARGTQNGREVNPLGARARSFVTLSVGKEKGNKHPAPMPIGLAEWMVLLSSPPGGTVLDPFSGSGTTLLASRKLGRRSIGIDRDESYCALAADRCSQLSLLAAEATA